MIIAAYPWRSLYDYCRLSVEAEEIAFVEEARRKKKKEKEESTIIAASPWKLRK